MLITLNVLSTKVLRLPECDACLTVPISIVVTETSAQISLMSIWNPQDPLHCYNCRCMIEKQTHAMIRMDERCAIYQIANDSKLQLAKNPSWQIWHVLNRLAPSFWNAKRLPNDYHIWHFLSLFANCPPIADISYCYTGAAYHGMLKSSESLSSVPVGSFTTLGAGSWWC
jgi:hypothetical protein